MKKYMLITLITIFTLCNLSSFTEGYRIFEIKSPAFEVDSNNKIILFYTLYNFSERSYIIEFPYEWYSLIWVWFNPFFNGEKLKNPLEYKDWGFKHKTTLEPYESVTIAFYLSDFAVLPDKKSSYSGRFEIMPTKTTDGKGEPILSTKPLVFYLVEPGKVNSLAIKDIKNKDDEEKAEIMIGLSSLSSYDKLMLIKMAISKNKKNLLWRLIFKSEDCFSIVSALMEMPVELFDKEALLALLPNKDLAIRREAIRALGKIGEDSIVAEKLSEFLSTQKDEVTLEYGKATLKALRSE